MSYNAYDCTRTPRLVCVSPLCAIMEATFESHALAHMHFSGSDLRPSFAIRLAERSYSNVRGPWWADPPERWSPAHDETQRTVDLSPSWQNNIIRRRSADLLASEPTCFRKWQGSRKHRGKRAISLA